MKLTKGEIPSIGVKGQCELFIGWTAPDPKNATPDVTEGYNTEMYFDDRGAYLGPDEFGVEPEFREMTEEEARDYLSQEGIG